MDKIRPKITVSEMQISRTDCASRYEICVQLLKNSEFFDRNVVLPRFVREEKRWDQWVGSFISLIILQCNDLQVDGNGRQ